MSDTGQRGRQEEQTMTERVINNYDTDGERISQRLIDGVRVIEKEMHRVIKLVNGRYVDASSKPAPRLVVVEDEGPNPASLITKDRTSIAGLDAILQYAMR